MLLLNSAFGKKNIEEMNIPEENIEYPLMEISIIKDDKIQYEPI